MLARKRDQRLGLELGARSQLKAKGCPCLIPFLKCSGKIRPAQGESRGGLTCEGWEPSICFLGVFPGPWVKAASVLRERFLELPVVLCGAAGESPVAFRCVSLLGEPAGFLRLTGVRWGGGSQCSKVPLSSFYEAASSQNLQPTWEGTRDVICADILGMPPCNKVEEVLGHRGVAPEGG